MIVTCENCAARFHLADERITPEGAKVRCSKCQHTFTVYSDVDAIPEVSSDMLEVDDVTMVEEDAPSYAPTPDDGPTLVPDLAGGSIHSAETVVLPVSSQLQQMTLGPEPSPSGLAAQLFDDLPTTDSSHDSPVSFEPFDSEPAPPPPQPLSFFNTSANPIEPSPLGKVLIFGGVGLSAAVFLAGIPYFFAAEAVQTWFGWRPRPPVMVANEEGSVSSVHAVSFPTQRGRALVVAGEASHRSTKPRNDLYVVAEFVGKDGKVVATEKAPLGVALTPAQLRQLSDAKSYDLALQKGIEGSHLAVPQERAVPYTVVFLSPPRGLKGLTQSVRLQAGDPVVPREIPAFTQEPVAAPKDDAEVSLEDDEDGDDVLGRKGKRKGPRKGKRKLPRKVKQANLKKGE